MRNPFKNRFVGVSGPSTDTIPVTPSDTDNLSAIAVALYVENGGALTVETVSGNRRTITLPDFMIWPCGVRRVFATGTDATGIHAFVVDETSVI